MTTYYQGEDAYFTSEFRTTPGGDHTNPTALSLSFLDDDGTLIAGPFVPPAVVRVSTGLYAYTWHIPADLTPGAYTAAWSATVAGNPGIGYESFSVLPGGAIDPGVSGCWATVQDVLTFTGETVDGTTLLRAQAIIDLHSSRTYAQLDGIGTRDRGWLKYATAYQAVWMKAQPDLYARLDLTTAPDVGSLAADGLTLAPLAARALRRLSWMRSRSLRTYPGRSRIAAFTNEASDAYHPWRRF